MKLYLDLCCFNRPFDDQGQLLVRLQTEAKLAVQESIRNRIHTLIWSGILDLENADNPDSERKAAIAEWRMLAEVDVVTTAAVEELASYAGWQWAEANGCSTHCFSDRGGCRLFSDDG